VAQQVPPDAGLTQPLIGAPHRAGPGVSVRPSVKDLLTQDVGVASVLGELTEHL
jgi:hypothetical protein